MTQLKRLQKFSLEDITDRNMPWYLKALNEKFDLRIRWELPQPNQADSIIISYVQDGEYKHKVLKPPSFSSSKESYATPLLENYNFIITNLLNRMSDRYLQVLQEKEDLNDKMEKLINFLNTPMENIPTFHKNLLREQYAAMAQYNSVLEERLSYNF